MSNWQDQLEQLSEERRHLLIQWLERLEAQTQLNGLGDGQLGAPNENQADSRIRLAAFVTAQDPAGELDTEALRQYLAQRLPDYMVPDSFQVLDALPKLPNGKLNAAALASVEQANRDVTEEFIEPRNDCEATLAQIWSDVLGSERIGIHDNFFEIGGDSILSIQVISAAREAGLSIQPKHLNSHPTIAELASLSQDRDESPVESGASYGSGPVTPIQAWFLQRELVHPGHWNLSRWLTLDPEIAMDEVKVAAQACLQTHDALRAHFESDNGDWRVVIDEAVGQVDIEERVCSSFADEDLEKLVVSRCSEFDLSCGPLIRFTVVRSQHAGQTRLLVTAHHLVIDFVSWTILLGDLERLLKRREAVGASAIDKSTSVLHWTKRLVEYASSRNCLDSLEYWDSVSKACSAVPIDIGASRSPTESSSRTVSRELEASATERLLKQAGDAYQMRPQELLLVSIAKALSEWMGKPTIRIDLEAHGRNDLFDEIRLDRTIGWFTAFFPMLIDGCLDQPLGESIRHMKEQIRDVPNQGLDYGVLRYLSSDPQLRKRMSDLPDGEVLFNYLGVETTARTDSGESLEFGQRAAENKRSHLLEINLSVSDGKLRSAWIYSEAVHHPQTIQHLASSFEKHLDLVIDHCCDSGEGSFTPSDFPDVNIDQSELDDLLDDL